VTKSFISNATVVGILMFSATTFAQQGFGEVLEASVTTAQGLGTAGNLAEFECVVKGQTIGDRTNKGQPREVQVAVWVSSEVFAKSFVMNKLGIRSSKTINLGGKEYLSTRGELLVSTASNGFGSKDITIVTDLKCLLKQK
jgi:hypothetical protein